MSLAVSISWRCPNCSLINHCTSPNCRACYTNKPSTKSHEYIHNNKYKAHLDNELEIAEYGTKRILNDKDEYDNASNIESRSDSDIDLSSSERAAIAIIVSILNQRKILSKRELHKEFEKINNGIHWTNSFQIELESSLKKFLLKHHQFTVINQNKKDFKVTLAQNAENNEENNDLRNESISTEVTEQKQTDNNNNNNDKPIRPPLARNNSFESMSTSTASALKLNGGSNDGSNLNDIYNTYNIGDKLEVHNIERDEWFLSKVIAKQNHWIVVHFDGYSSKYDEQIHVIQQKHRMRQIQQSTHDNDAITSKKCNVCSQVTQQRCSGCKCIYYCSINCQRQDWNIHKIECKKLRHKLSKPVPNAGDKRQNMRNILQALDIENTYIERAFKVYEKNYGNNYNVHVLKDIIVKLEKFGINGRDLKEKIVDNKYFIDNKLQIQNKQTHQWLLATIVLTEDNWIVVHFDGSLNEYHETIHVIHDKDRINDPPEWVTNLEREVKAQNCSLQEVYTDNAIYACFAEEIYETANGYEVIEEQCNEYINNNYDIFSCMIGPNKIISALSELFNVNVTVFEYDNYEKGLYTSFDCGGGHDSIPSILLAKYGLKYCVIRDSESKHERPLDTAEYREYIAKQNGEIIVSLRKLRLAKQDEEKEDINERMNIIINEFNEKYERLTKLHQDKIEELNNEIATKNKLTNMVNGLTQKTDIMKKENDKLIINLEEYMEDNDALNEKIKLYIEANDQLNTRVNILNGTASTDKFNTLNLKELNGLELKLQNGIRKIQNARNRLIEQKFNCIVCLDAPKNILIDGCNHIVLCQQCENRLISKICPMCQTPYKTIKKIHI